MSTVFFLVLRMVSMFFFCLFASHIFSRSFFRYISISVYFLSHFTLPGSMRSEDPNLVFVFLLAALAGFVANIRGDLPVFVLAQGFAGQSTLLVLSTMLFLTLTALSFV
jgi:hypothetical protein